MRILASSLAVVAASVLTVTSTPASAAAPQEHQRRDAAGDARGAEATEAQLDTVDLRSVSIVVGPRKLTVTRHYTDLLRTPGNQFAEIHVSGDGREEFDFSSDLTSGRVMVFDGDHYYPCRGATLSVDYRRDVVRQVIPSACVTFYDYTEARFVVSDTLAEDDASQIAYDRVARSRTFSV